MMPRIAGLLVAALLASTLARAQDGPASANLARELKPYGEFTPHALLSWHPLRREMLVGRALDGVEEIHRVAEPGAVPQPLTYFPEGVNDARYQPANGESFVFPFGGHDEAARLYRFDIAARAATSLSAAGHEVIAYAWNRKGDRVVFATTNAGQTTVLAANPRQADSARVMARLPGSAWSDFHFSEDGRRIAFIERISPSESHIWVMDAGTGRRYRITSNLRGVKATYLSPRFSRDGKGLFARGDHESEHKRLVYIPLAGGKERVLTANLAYDVDDYEISFDANLIAFVTNESGSHVLRFLELPSLKQLPRPPLFHGVIAGLAWLPKSDEVAFSITSARSGGDVFSYQVKANQLTRWTNGNNPNVNTREFAEPRIARWPGFDGREITGLHYHPPERFKDKRPVIVVLPGPPGSQARAGFIGRMNYVVSELGIAVIYPNVRGSAGFGKTFLALGDTAHGEDREKDIAALREWIKRQPDLDGERVMVIPRDETLASAEQFAAMVERARSELLK
jgi:dipeptidyl aminopeptidase/acylaminoacyl peptidase